MSLRPATTADIPEMMRIRFIVKENVLSNPALVTDADVQRHLTELGFGYVWELAPGRLAGFSIMNAVEGSVWALFMDPAWEGRGIGRQLFEALIDRYFEAHDAAVWLSTDPGTRADAFYRKAGWVADEELRKGERVYRITRAEWLGRGKG